MQSDIGFAQRAIDIAKHGESYVGMSHPSWYSRLDLQRLLNTVSPESTSVAQLVKEVFGVIVEDDRPARTLNSAEADKLRREICRLTGEPPTEIGHIGPFGEGVYYSRVIGMASIKDAALPFTVEVFVHASAVEQRRDGSVSVELLLNRSPCVGAVINGNCDRNGLWLRSGDCFIGAPTAKDAHYDILLSLISPYIQLSSDGKSPALAPYKQAMLEALKKAAGAPYRAITRPAKQISIKDAAWRVMERAYLAASGDAKLPANARQIMYAARPLVLEMTGAHKLSDTYFTQTLLPDYLTAHPEQCKEWDVVFDARGHLTEPHTRTSIPVGTSPFGGTSAVDLPRARRSFSISGSVFQHLVPRTDIGISCSSRRKALTLCFNTHRSQNVLIWLSCPTKE